MDKFDETDSNDILTKHFNSIMISCKNVLDSKNKEYSKRDNPFENFEATAREAGISVCQAWLVFFKKHIDSISSWCRVEKVFSNETIEGRIIDAINYLVMLYAYIQEKKNIK